MAHPPGLAGTYDVCAVQKSQKVKRVEVTVDSGAEESVWPAKLLQEIPTVKGEGGRTKFLVVNRQEMGHYCTNFVCLRCDTIDDSGVSTQRHDGEDKCAK